MRMMTLGKTGITVPQNAFGALPIQRVDKDTAKAILLRAYEGGMRLFDTARGYTDSEEKIGYAFADIFKNNREEIFITTKTMAKTPAEFWEQLDTSLNNMGCGYIDVYQFHCAGQCYRPGDGTGMYECMLEAKEQGKIKHIGITAHKIQIAMECVESGLYETMQFPFCYLSGDKEIELVNACKKNNVGFIAMKGLAGGLITNSAATMAYMLQYDNVLPIWGIQKMSELEEWLSYMDKEPEMDAEMTAFINAEKKELGGEFCRGCGYCMPCPVGIEINTCARMSLLLRRAPSAWNLSPEAQEKMNKIEDCLKCGKCMTKCPYELNTPKLLEKNLADYREIIAKGVTGNVE